MKLQTMLLPTGEFLLIFSEAPRPLPTEEDGWPAEFRDQIGAAAVLFVEHSVEIENAYVDSAAKRVIPREIRVLSDEPYAPSGLDCPCWPEGVETDARCGGCPKRRPETAIDKAKPEHHDLRVGDLVKIKGMSVYGFFDGDGRVGKILKVNERVPEHDGELFLVVEFYSDEFKTVRRFYRAEQLERLLSGTLD